MVVTNFSFDMLTFFSSKSVYWCSGAILLYVDFNDKIDKLFLVGVS